MLDHGGEVLDPPSLARLGVACDRLSPTARSGIETRKLAIGPAETMSNRMVRRAIAQRALEHGVECESSHSIFGEERMPKAEVGRLDRLWTHHYYRLIPCI